MSKTKESKVSVMRRFATGRRFIKEWLIKGLGTKDWQQCLEHAQRQIESLAEDEMATLRELDVKREVSDTTDWKALSKRGEKLVKGPNLQHRFKTATFIIRGTAPLVVAK